ncbi:hypothetical protein BV898_20011, partial [Hypsibius exemplaris]
ALLNACDGKVNSPGWHGDTPLHIACCLNLTEVSNSTCLWRQSSGGFFSGMKPITTPQAAATAREFLNFQ